MEKKWFNRNWLKRIFPFEFGTGGVGKISILEHYQSVNFPLPLFNPHGRGIIRIFYKESWDNTL
ncbi:hypothetical protein ACFOZY_14915 [Chungangia koreensis]|uniref:Uncharacterized protein n=1 Tax=Chungangia koreensis TaxID=752657 RepID=A0ABV8X7Y9_9LACT